MFAFLALLFVLIVIFFFTGQKEGFNPVNTSPSHKVNIPVNVIPPTIPPPPVRNVDDSNVRPSDLPGKLPVAPYQQIAAMSPLPYQDTSLIKANRQQLVSMLELLKGFLAFEAQEISERSDPTIQLPLNTARSDFQTLQSEVEVLNRNPGLQPTITLSYLNEISSNLAYLQREVRLIGSAGPIQGPIYEFTERINVVGGALEGFENMNGEMSTGTKGAIATPDELKDFVAKVQGEIIRLSASGTTDPIINARIIALTQIKNDIDTILEQVETGALMPVEIPIMKSDIDRAFPILGKTDQPLPQIIKQLGLPPGLANILPANTANNPEMTREINKLMDKYAETVVNGLSGGISATVALKYTSPREAEKARSQASTIDLTGFPSLTDLNNTNNAYFMPNGEGPSDSRITMETDFSGKSSVTDRLAPLPQDAGRGPSKFDWKQRAKDIENQVKKRGLKPEDFGIMPQNTRVSNDFSWKGYTRMICTRLQATPDPGLPETCGCPPMDWPGWRIAK
jgi:hypothetical protein